LAGERDFALAGSLSRRQRLIGDAEGAKGIGFFAQFGLVAWPKRI